MCRFADLQLRHNELEDGGAKSIIYTILRTIQRVNVKEVFTLILCQYTCNFDPKEKERKEELVCKGSLF